MKKIILVILSALFISSPGMANVYIDTYGAFVGTQDAGYQMGGGIAFGFDIYKDLSVIYRGMYTLKNEQASSYFQLSKSYSHIMNLVGVEYIFRIDAAHLAWRSSVQFGISRTEMDEFDDVSSYVNTTILQYMSGAGAPVLKNKKLSDMGLSFAFWTGIQFYALQHLAPFIDIGYHRSFYSNNMMNKTIQGLNLMVGLRFYIKPARNMKEEY